MPQQPRACSWAILALGMAVAPAGADEPPSAGEPAVPPAGRSAQARGESDDLLSLPLPPLPGADPLEWILRRVSARADAWAGERLYEEISPLLHVLEDLLREPGRLEEGLEDLLTADFRSDSLRGRETAALDTPLCRASRVARGTGAGEVKKPELAGELRAFLAPLGRVEKTKIKVYRAEPLPAPARGAVLDTLFEADGEGAAGLRTQLRSEFRLLWREDAGRLRLGRLELLRAERAQMAERPFTDITDRAMGECASYRDQLRYGLEHWRTRLDAASGIEIYGHQGIAVGDVDGDGREDFYVAQPAGLPNRLYRAREDGRYEDITAAAGVAVLDETGAVLFFDADNDGDPDLLVVTPLELLLFENRGGGRFHRREATGLEATEARRASLLGAAIADYDLDGDLDLYIVSYVFWAGSASKASSSYPFPYHDANNGAPNFLFRNEGGFRFRDVTEASGMNENNRRFSLAASWCDYDEDGDPDLYVANDFGRKNLYRNEGVGRFRDVAAELGVEDTGNGMSVAWEDYDGDAREDLYAGNMWSSAGSRLASHPGFRGGAAGLAPLYARMAKGNTLFRNVGGGKLEDVTERAGVAFGRWSWASQFLDVDGDGNEDLYVVNGFVTGEKTDDL